MSGALAVGGSGCGSGGGSGCATSATGSTGFASGEGADCCASPHPTRSKAAIVVSRRCLIESYLGRGTDEGVGI